jgi:hypothetical protein
MRELECKVISYVCQVYGRALRTAGTTISPMCGIGYLVPTTEIEDYSYQTLPPPPVEDKEI